jgi:hypothetical protein
VVIYLLPERSLPIREKMAPRSSRERGATEAAQLLIRLRNHVEVRGTRQSGRRFAGDH